MEIFKRGVPPILPDAYIGGVSMEIWKDIEGYEGLYQISNFGRIKFLYNYRGRNNILVPRIKRGYYQIGLRKNVKRKWFAVHRLVAKAFIDNPNNYPVINHIDEDKLNNNVDNLEWCTYKYNNSYGNRIKKVVQTNKLRKEIAQYTLDGELVKEFFSIAEASRQTGFSMTNISNCVNGIFKQANGYIWKLKGGGT